MESWSGLDYTNHSITSCPTPFIAELSIQHDGGYVAGRWCQLMSVDDETVSCCFPCPITYWRYSDEFNADMVPWIGLVVLIVMLISLLTYAVLPVSATQRHYLTTAPLMGFIFMTVAFIIPLGPSVRYCYDTITPNYWLSDTACAFSGSLLLYGVWVLNIGCLFRSLALYIQLCWEHEPGHIFRTVSLICIFIGSLALLGIALGVSGVSYQVGDVCYISYPRSMGSFWGPLIAVAAFCFFIQILIIVYCVRGVLSHSSSSSTSSLATYSCLCKRSTTSNETSARIRRILQLQWRAVAIVILVLFHVVFVAQAVLRYRGPKSYSLDELRPWISCLIRTEGDRDECLSSARELEPSQAMAVGALALLASCGIWGFICTVRVSMLIAWWVWIKEKSKMLLNCANPHRRPRSTDIQHQYLPSRSSTDYSLRLNPIGSPDPLEEAHGDAQQSVARVVYATRVYRVPKHSFSAPGRSGIVTTVISGGKREEV